MSQPHLDALERALTGRGWRVVEVQIGDGYRVAGTWVIQRGEQSRLLIDFDGLSADGDRCLPLVESYGCGVRGKGTPQLYFRKINRSRRVWEQELAAFVSALDDLSDS